MIVRHESSRFRGFARFGRRAGFGLFALLVLASAAIAVALASLAALAVAAPTPSAASSIRGSRSTNVVAGLAVVFDAIVVVRR